MQERIAHTLSTLLAAALLLGAPPSALAATLLFDADSVIVANGGPVEVSPFFGALVPGGVVGTAARDFGLDFSLDSVEGVFIDFDSEASIAGVNSGGVLDLVSPVDAAIVMPGTLDPARTSYIRAEAGDALAGTLTLDALDANGAVIASATNDLPLGPNNRRTMTIDRMGVSDIAGFRVSGADTWGLTSVEIESPVPASPGVVCPNDGNPFGVDGAILFTGSSGDAWEGCSDIVKRLDAGTTTRGVFVTRGNQPSPAPQVPCQMPMDEEENVRIVAEGDEICGLDAIIEVDRGGATIEAFLPSHLGITSVMPQGGFPTQSLRVVTVPPVETPLAEPWYHKLGDITITVPQNDPTRVVAKSGVGVGGILSADDTPVPMDVNLYAREGVGAMPANLEAEGLINTVLFVPEPAAWLQWPSALLGLTLLARLRRRRD
jgi:hypothetical protein